MKKRNVLVLALAALVLLSLTVMISPGWVAAQQPGASDNKKEVDLARRLEKALKEAELAKAEAAELRDRLEKERQRAAQAERAARAEREAVQKAEAQARQRAEQAQRETEKALLKARKEAEWTRYAAALQAAQAELAKRQEQKAKVVVKPLPAELALAKEKLLAHFNLKRADLMVQLKRLDEEQQKVLAELEKTALHTQILERLERIERRLDRLEKSQLKAPQQPKKSP